MTLVPPKKLAKRKKVDEVKPVSGLDIEALLLRGSASQTSESSQSKRQKLEIQIGLADPAKDFKHLIDNEEYSWKPGASYLSPAYKSFQGNGDGDQKFGY
jgi:hypothetical protein